MKPKRLGRGLRGLIKNPDAPTSPPPRVQPVRPATKGEESSSTGGASTASSSNASPSSPHDALSRSPRPAPGGGRETAISPPAAVALLAEERTGLRHIHVSDVHPNPFQPRSDFSEDELLALQASIQEHGLLQPVVVRKAEVGFELIAGERRLRASKALGLERIPAVVRHADDAQMQTLALVENLQRVDLNALEKAKALKAMMRNFGFTQQEVADKVGKARTSISNLVRLLDLPVVIQDMVAAGGLSGSQARAVLLAAGTERRISLAEKAVKSGLTVRQIEKLATKERRQSSLAAETPDPYVQDLEERLRRALGTRVNLKTRGGGGSIEIRYHDASELDRLLEKLGAE